MAQAIIYANGETSGSSFHLVSEWKGSTTGYEYGPTISSATYSYSLSGLPKGAKNVKATVYARIGARFTPLSGTASSYPKANGVRFTKVTNSSDPNLYSARVEFSDASISTKVTYSFKANGDASIAIPRSGSLSFDDVYLLVEYTPPCSDWMLSSTSEYVGETIWADVVLTEDNALYSHKVVVSCGSGLLFTGSASPGQSRIWIALNSAWMEQFPDSTVGVARAVLETYNENGELLGVSDPVEIELLCPDDMVPTAGTITITGTSMFGGQVYIQGVSTAVATTSGWSGVYGSTIKSVSLTGNGKSVVKDLSSVTSAYSDELILNAGLLKSAGPVTFTLTVIDSRGRSASVTSDISVVAYSPVSIVSTTQGRITNSDANSGDTGYVRVEYSYSSGISYTSGNQNIWNSPVLTVSWGADSKAVDGYASKSQVNFAENSLSKNQMYTIVLHLTDGITSTTAVRKIGTAYAFMRWDPKNNAVGFGCYPQQSKCVEIGADWTLIVDKDILIQDPAVNQLVS